MNINLKLDNNIEIRSAGDIMLDFVYALDEAVATYKILGKIAEEDTRPNQLLFCHIINNFDSFVNSLLTTIIFSNNDRLKEYLKRGKSFEEKPSLEEVIYMHENGIYEWMKIQAKNILEQDIKRKRHAQKLELLLENSNVDYKNIFIYLTGPGKTATGCFKKKPTPKTSQTTNHKTNSEKLLGYADILYEKRNAITHNRNNYPRGVIGRLNSEWGIEIVRNNVLIRRDTINALLRFYTSISLELIKSDSMNYDDQSEQLINYLETIKNCENIKIINDGEDLREKGGGIEGRKKILFDSGLNSITIKKYTDMANTSPGTANRDFKTFSEQKIIRKTRKRGEYKVVNIIQKGDSRTLGNNLSKKL